MEWVQSHIAWFGGTNEFVSTMLVCGDSLIHLKMPMVAMQQSAVGQSHKLPTLHSEGLQGELRPFCWHRRIAEALLPPETPLLTTDRQPRSALLGPPVPGQPSQGAAVLGFSSLHMKGSSLWEE